MNSSSIIVYFENGTTYDIHMPDPSFADGYTIQREFIDISNPDQGIWVEREYMDVASKEDGGRFMPLADRLMVCGPDELSAAMLVTVRGQDALRRSSDAHFACGMEPVMLESIGFTEDEATTSGEWLIEGLVNMARRCEMAGLVPAEAFAAALKKHDEGADGLPEEGQWRQHVEQSEHGPSD